MPETTDAPPKPALPPPAEFSDAPPGPSAPVAQEGEDEDGTSSRIIRKTLIAGKLSTRHGRHRNTGRPVPGIAEGDEEQDEEAVLPSTDAGAAEATSAQPGVDEGAVGEPMRRYTTAELRRNSLV